MLILKPIIHETIWGGEKLYKYVADEENKKIGHLYLVSGRKGMSNEIINGRYKGKTLSEVFNIQKKAWKMEEYEEFPLTIALVDAFNNLSIQVHPDDVTAKRLEGKRIGKMESWLFLEGPDSGWIYDGCACTEEAQLKATIEERRMEEIAARLKVDTNDYVCIKAGTLHAMTAGSLVYEIEYGSDYTYRFYDYNRRDEQGNKRELHIEKALESIKLNLIPKVQKSVIGQWISEEKYEIQKVKKAENYQNLSCELECISLLDGEGMADGCKISSGMGVLLSPGEKLDNVTVHNAIIARMRNIEREYEKRN